MTRLVFPDNTVLINLAYINAIHLIRLRNTQATWCASVAQECRKSSRTPGLEALEDAPCFLGKPLYPDGAEHSDIRIIRQDMAVPGDPITAHLGEAETIAIITRRRINAVFVTDDREATRVARAHGITVASTWDILRLAVRLSLITPTDFWNHCLTLNGKGRGWPPCGRSRAEVDSWLQQT
mgnify:CR=1 FL=1